MKSLPNPENTHPPTKEELKKLVEIADSHIGGEEVNKTPQPLDANFSTNSTNHGSCCTESILW